MCSRYKKLLEYMLVDLIYCWQRQQPESILLESAFLTSQKHCNNARSHVWQHGFENVTEEIYFFKTIQPQIAGRVMYYAILYESLLSCPKGSEEEYAFWEQEVERYERFAAKNETVIGYIMSGSTEWDDQYFSHNTQITPYTWDDKISFVCAELQTGWSVPAIKYFAEKHYRNYAEVKLQNLVPFNNTCPTKSKAS